VTMVPAAPPSSLTVAKVALSRRCVVLK